MPLPEVVTVIICAIVLFGTIVGVIGGVMRAARMVRALRPGRLFVESLASEAAPQDAFSRRWAEVDAHFGAVSALAPIWAPFASTVERGSDADGNEGMWSTTAPGEWFQASMLEAGRWGDVTIARLAGLLVSLGILGTFLGLTLGLVDADFGGIQSLTAGDARTEALQAAMFGLLAGSSTAFVTSVAGLSGSLLLTSVVRLWAGRWVEDELARTAAALRAGIRVEAPEAQLSRHLRQLVDRPASAAPLGPVVERLAQAVDGLRKAESGEGVWPVNGAPDGRQDAPDLHGVLADLQSSLQQLAQPVDEPQWAVLLREQLTAPSEQAAWAERLEARLVSQQDALAELVAVVGTQQSRWSVLEAQLRAPGPTGEPVSPESPELMAVLQKLGAQIEIWGAATATTGADVSAASEGVAPQAGRPMETASEPTLAEWTPIATQFSEASAQFDSATRRLDAAARSNHDAAETLRQASDHLANRLAVLQQSTAALRTGLAHHTDASTALTSAAATLQAVGPQLGRASDQIRLSASSMELTAERLAAAQRASGSGEIDRLVPLLEALLAQLERRS